MQALCQSLASNRKRVLDLCSLCLGVSAVTLYKYFCTITQVELALLIGACLIYTLASPLVTLSFDRRHFTTETGLFSEKRAHLSLFLSSQAWAVFSLLAIRYLDIGDAVTLSHVANVLTPIVSYYALDSKLDPRQIVLLPVSFVGVVFLCRPMDIFLSSDVVDCLEELYGVFAAVGASICRSVMAASLKGARKTPHLVSIFVASGASVIVWTCALVPRLQYRATSCWEGVVLLVCGILFGGCILVRRTAWNSTSRLQATLCVVAVLMGYSVQALLFGVSPNWSTAVGATVILLSTLGSALCGMVGSNRTTSVGSQFSLITSRKSSTPSPLISMESEDMKDAHVPTSSILKHMARPTFPEETALPT